MSSLLTALLVAPQREKSLEEIITGRPRPSGSVPTGATDYATPTERTFLVKWANAMRTQKEAAQAVKRERRAKRKGLR